MVLLWLLQFQRLMYLVRQRHMQQVIPTPMPHPPRLEQRQTHCQLVCHLREYRELQCHTVRLSFMDNNHTKWANLTMGALVMDTDTVRHNLVVLSKVDMVINKLWDSQVVRMDSQMTTSPLNSTTVVVIIHFILLEIVTKVDTKSLVVADTVDVTPTTTTTTITTTVATVISTKATTTTPFNTVVMANPPTTWGIMLIIFIRIEADTAYRMLTRMAGTVAHTVDNPVVHRTKIS